MKYKTTKREAGQEQSALLGQGYEGERGIILAARSVMNDAIFELNDKLRTGRKHTLECTTPASANCEPGTVILISLCDSKVRLATWAVVEMS